MNITKKRLAELHHILPERDKAVLRSLRQCRYFTTGQIARLHFSFHANTSAALRAAQRVMVGLQGFGLALALKRRIGGVRAGSASYVWVLSESGVKFMSISSNDTDDTPRKHSFEPSPNFLSHTLAVSETYIRLTEICRRHGLELISAQLEPESWRDYVGENNKPATLKHDLFVMTSDSVYEYLYFLEVDMDTEAASVVLKKLLRYTFYCKRGIEQKKYQMFPLVVWIVPTPARRDSLKSRIYEYHKLPYKNLFTVITPEEFETLIIQGAEAPNEKKGA